MKKPWELNRVLRAPVEDDIFEGGGGESQINDDDEEFEPVFEGEDDDGQKGEEEEETPALTPQQIAQLAAQTAMQMGGQRQEREAPQMSKEDMMKALNYTPVSADLIKALRNPEITPEEAVALMQQALDGSVKHAMTSMQVMMQQQLSPIQQWQQQQAEAQRVQRQNEFTGKVEKYYPALKGMKIPIQQAIKHLSDQGYNPPSKSAAYKEVARTAARIVKSINPQFRLASSGGRQASSFGSRSTGGRAPMGPQGKQGPGSFSDLLGG